MIPFAKDKVFQWEEEMFSIPAFVIKVRGGFELHSPQNIQWEDIFGKSVPMNNDIRFEHTHWFATKINHFLSSEKETFFQIQYLGTILNIHPWMVFVPWQTFIIW